MSEPLAHEFDLAEQLVGDAPSEIVGRDLLEGAVRHLAGRAGHCVDASDLLVHRRDHARVGDVDGHIVPVA
jgi:hypothetical protein